MLNIMPVRKGKKKPGSEDKRCLLKFSSRHCRQTNVGEFSRGQDLGLTGMLAANYLENKNLAMKSVYFLLCRFHIFIYFIQCEYFIPYYSQNLDGL